MSKTKTAFFCQNCGYESTKWAGKCPACNEWNTFVEELIVKGADKSRADEWNDGGRKIKIVSLGEVHSSEEQRIITGDSELDRVLGGGIVGGSIVLVAGEPGIGKSTLFLQMALGMKNITTLYVSGEESVQQIKMRADRLGA
ncbi:MAG: DNA repair protein RadA, partial [Flavobacterium sp.]